MLRRQLNLKKYYMVLFLCIISIWLAYVYNFNKKSLALDEIPIESQLLRWLCNKSKWLSVNRYERVFEKV